MKFKGTGRKKLRAVALALSILAALACVLPLSGCGDRSEEGKITVVCSVFPIYDWVRSVVGEAEDIRVVLLIDGGEDIHSFQPTARDAVALRTADLVVRAGGSDDSVIEELVKKGEGKDLPLMEAAEGLRLRCPSVSSEHSHEEHSHEGHDHTYDGHIWLSLKNAAACVSAISGALTELQPENRALFEKNAAEYREQIEKLDAKYSAEISKIHSPRIVAADRFPFVYLTEDYGIAYEAAFEGCTTDAEAGFDTILRLARCLERWEMSALIVCEGSDTRLAEAVAGETGRKIKTVTLHSMQSVGMAEIDSGAGYLQIMEGNLTALMSALKN